MLLLAACEPPDPASPTSSDSAEAAGTLLASDLRGNSWVTLDLDSGEQAAYGLDRVEPGVCEGDDQPQYCLLFQSMHRTAYDGADEIVFTWSPLDSSDGSDDEREDLIGRFQSVDAETWETRWGFSYLDFSGVGGEHCAYDPADPCHPPDSLDARDYWRCRLHMPHELAVVAEDDAGLRGWVADSRNSRIVELTIPRDSDCAVVEEVLGQGTSGWDGFTSPNSVKYVEDDGVPSLLFTVKGTVGEAGGEDHGKLLYWQAPEGEWRQTWEFPAAEDAFVNAPHGASFATSPTGSPWAVFAHSLGASEDWGRGTGGSIAVVSLADADPVYLYDAVLPDDAPLRFPRDVTPMNGGRFVLADSGCLGADCDFDTAAWIVSLPDADPPGLTGAWTAGADQQVRVELTPEEGPLLSDLDMLYSIEWIE